MWKNVGSTAGALALVAITAAVFITPPAKATVISYDFTVDVTSGPLTGVIAHGSFSYDSSSIVPGGGNDNLGQLTALDFAFDGVKFNANTANTGWLGFDPAGELTSFTFGTNRFRGGCGIDGFGNGLRWCAVYQQYQDLSIFAYSIDNEYYGGKLTFARAPASVSEPASLGIFGFGTLLIGVFAGIRRHRRVINPFQSAINPLRYRA